METPAFPPIQKQTSRGQLEGVPLLEDGQHLVPQGA